MCKDIQNITDLHVALAKDAGVPMYPKHHLFRHLAAEICRKGNPRFYSTYHDESVNGVIANIAATTHRARLERMTFRKYGYLTTEGHAMDKAEAGFCLKEKLILIHMIIEQNRCLA